MTVDRVWFSLHRRVLQSLSAALLLLLALLWLWWTVVIGPFEKFYLPTYVRSEFWSLWKDEQRPFALFMAGGYVADESQLEQNVPGLVYRVKKWLPSQAHALLRERIYHGSLPGRFAWPVGVSFLFLVMFLPWGWYLDAKRITAMRGDGWQIKGRKILTPNAQRRQTEKGGLDVWTDN